MMNDSKYWAIVSIMASVLISLGIGALFYQMAATDTDAKHKSDISYQQAEFRASQQSPALRPEIIDNGDGTYIVRYHENIKQGIHTSMDVNNFGVFFQ